MLFQPFHPRTEGSGSEASGQGRIRISRFSFRLPFCPVHLEAVRSGGHPACRRGRASCRPAQRLKRGCGILARTRGPPGRMPAATRCLERPYPGAQRCPRARNPQTCSVAKMKSPGHAIGFCKKPASLALNPWLARSRPQAGGAVGFHSTLMRDRRSALRLTWRLSQPSVDFKASGTILPL